MTLGLHVLGQQVSGVAGVPLVDVDRDERERDGRAGAKAREKVMHRVAVFAAGNGNQDSVAVVDHAKVFDGAGHRAGETPFDAQLVGRHSHRDPDCSTNLRNVSMP